MRDDSKPGDDEVLKVSVDRPDGLRLNVATTQVPQVRVLFDGVGINYAIEAIQDNISSFTFFPDVTAQEIQLLLDGID